MSESSEAIIQSLEPLFRSATENGLWFVCSYQSMWFSPEELRQKHAKGLLLWGPDNWTLRHPENRLKELEQNITTAIAEVEEFKRRMKVTT